LELKFQAQVNSPFWCGRLAYSTLA
jgi:hypothetical protein